MNADYVKYLNIAACPLIATKILTLAAKRLKQQATQTGACSLHFAEVLSQKLRARKIPADTGFLHEGVFIALRFNRADEKKSADGPVELVTLSEDQFLAATKLHKALIASAWDAVRMPYYYCAKCMPTPFHYVADYDKYSWQTHLPVAFVEGAGLAEVPMIQQVAAVHHFWIVRGKPNPQEWWSGLLPSGFDLAALHETLNNCWLSFGAEIQQNTPTAAELAGVDPNLLELPEDMATSQPASVDMPQAGPPHPWVEVASGEVQQKKLDLIRSQIAVAAAAPVPKKQGKPKKWIRVIL